MRALIFVVMSTVVACGDPGGSSNAGEVITTVSLEFVPVAANPPVTFEFDDPDGDGGDPPVIDPIELAPGDYTMNVRFENRLEDPAEDITIEVQDEHDQHLLLFTGTAVVGPATDNLSGPLAQDYADEDANGFPVGLSNDITATAGSGTMTVTLRHMPPEEPPVKAADTVDIARDQGIDAIGGNTDVSVTFDVTVL